MGWSIRAGNELPGAGSLQVYTRLHYSCIISVKRKNGISEFFFLLLRTFTQIRSHTNKPLWNAVSILYIGFRDTEPHKSLTIYLTLKEASNYYVMIQYLGAILLKFCIGIKKLLAPIFHPLSYLPCTLQLFSSALSVVSTSVLCNVSSDFSFLSYHKISLKILRNFTPLKKYQVVILPK